MVIRNEVALRLTTDKQTGQHRTFGFCEYYDTDAAQHAVASLNRVEINGKQLKVAACNNGGMLAALPSHQIDLTYMHINTTIIISSAVSIML